MNGAGSDHEGCRGVTTLLIPGLSQQIVGSISQDSNGPVCVSTTTQFSTTHGADVNPTTT